MGPNPTGLTGIPPPVNPSNPLNKLALGATGLHHVPGARVIPVRPTPLILTWLAPQPIGVVPPRFFGLPENYFFGFTTAEIFALGPQATTGDVFRQRAALREALPIAQQILALQNRVNEVSTADVRTVAELAAKIEIVRQAVPDLRAQLPSVRSVEIEFQTELRDRTQNPALVAERRRLLREAGFVIPTLADIDVPPAVPPGMRFVDPAPTGPPGPADAVKAIDEVFRQNPPDP